MYEATAVSQYPNIFLLQNTAENVFYFWRVVFSSRLQYYIWVYSLSKTTGCCSQYRIHHRQRPKQQGAWSSAWKKHYLQNLVTSYCLTGFHRKSSIYDANSSCMYFVKKTAEIMVAYSELLLEANALQLRNYHSGVTYNYTSAQTQMFHLPACEHNWRLS